MNIISRKEAIKNGLKRYFNGKECLNGHITERYVSNGKCVICDRERCKEHYRKNSDKIKEVIKSYYNNNLEKCKEDRKKWAQENKERVNELARINRSKNPEARRESWRKWKDNNPEKIKEQRKKSYHKNYKNKLEYSRKYAVENREKVNEKSRRWASLNKEKKNYLTSKHRAKKLNATVSWANNFFINEIYRLSKLRTELTGINWHVDHIIPLQGKLVSGLHTHNNLQVIPAIENIKKRNNFIG